MTRIFGRSCYGKFLLCLLFPVLSFSKKISGDFQLSGVNTEHVLVSFAVGRNGGIMSVTFTSKDMYENERFLKLRIIKDTEWDTYQKYALCTEKARLARDSVSLSFDWVDKLWRSYEITMALQNRDGSPSDRAHYWYIVIDDCSLEQVLQDGRIPQMHYEMTIENYIDDNRQTKTHLPADDQHLVQLHTFTFILSTIVTTLLVINVALQAQKAQVVHAALIWVAISSVLDAASSLLEIMHVKSFESNGTGIYMFDALAAHCEAICDAFLMLMLLSVGSGWTLPHDAVRVNPNESTIQHIITDMASPIASIKKTGAAAVLGISILALHVILAQWGRIYNDDFESYHSFAHFPGKLMMLLRVCTGALFVTATLHTRLSCKVGQLQVFYAKLALLGFVWFQSLPVLTFICNRLVSYHLRNPAVVIGTATSQSICIMLLAWLVSSHSSTYHQYSHITGTKRDNLLTESLAGDSEGRIWKMGKAKIRLD